MESTFEHLKADPLAGKYLRDRHYWRNPLTGVIRLKVPKLRGKAAVKAAKRARRR